MNEKRNFIFSLSLGFCIGLILNFAIFRVYMALVLKRSLGDQLSLGLANDIWVAMIAALIVAIIFTILRIEGKNRWGRITIRGVLFIIAVFIGITCHSYLEYYRFSGAYLSPDLYAHYLFQVNYFNKTLFSKDFQVGFFFCLIIVWIIVAAFSVFYSIKAKIHIKKVAWVVIPLFLIAGIGRFVKGDEANIRENFLDYIVVNGLRSYKAVLFDPQGQTAIETCLNSRFDYPDSRYPFYRTAKHAQSEHVRLTDIRQSKPRIIFIVMESLALNLLDSYTHAQVPLTPELEKIIARGWYFENFYGNGVQTSRGQFSILTSMYDHFGAAVSAEYPKLHVQALPHILKKYGYENVFLQAAVLQFENQDRAMRALGFNTVAGYTELQSKLPAGADNGWGMLDEHMFKIAADYIDCHREKPQFVTLATITNHHPYEVPRKEFELFPLDSLENRMRNTARYADYALGQFLHRLEERGLMKNTIVVITGDHSQPRREHNNIMEIALAYEENYRIPLVIYAPDFIQKPRIYRVIGSQIDILPTLLALIQAEEPTNAFAGSDLLDNQACHFAVMLQPFGERMSAVRSGQYKYVYNWREKTGQVYDLTADPGEQHPMSLTEFPQAKELHDFLIRTVLTSNRVIEKNLLLPPAAWPTQLP